MSKCTWTCGGGQQRHCWWSLCSQTWQILLLFMLLRCCFRTWKSWMCEKRDNFERILASSFFDELLYFTFPLIVYFVHVLYFVHQSTDILVEKERSMTSKSNGYKKSLVGIILAYQYLIAICKLRVKSTKNRNVIYAGCLKRGPTTPTV